jgi:hypothetical protein
MSISTATPAPAIGPTLLNQSQRIPQPVALSGTNDFADSPDLTIHRVTATHHGRTLLMLGHAVEYLVDTRRFLQATVSDSDNEAVHILMGLSRSVFDEYAESASRGRRLDRLVLCRLTRLLN